MIVSEQLNYIKTRRFHAIFMPVIIEFSRCIGTYSSAKFEYINDIIVPKFGKKFDDISNLFDHAAHNGSGYLNGHCFVSVMLCVPVWNKGRIVYQSLPLSYHIWQKKRIQTGTCCFYGAVGL